LSNQFLGAFRPNRETLEEAALDRDPAIVTDGTLANFTCEKQARLFDRTERYLLRYRWWV